jgi:hypothetical protein
MGHSPPYDGLADGLMAQFDDLVLKLAFLTINSLLR